MAYSAFMRFIETPVFTRALEGLLNDEHYHALQLALIIRPHLGRTIPQSGGLRKMRWSPKGRGKRGGLRLIYSWDEASETFYMLYVYPKSEREDLSAKQLQTLSRLMREEFR
jgi:mRNA-degrading endonuclease RelE of RelBE toxin-antitoxin system